MGSIPRLKRGEKLLLATHNAGKVAEFRELCTPLGLVLISAADLGLPEPVETGTTFAENARLKAHAAASAANMIALADDSGLCVDAIGGEPGVYTADWAQTPQSSLHPPALAATIAQNFTSRPMNRMRILLAQ